MKGITFGSYHSYDSFKLFLIKKTIGTPSPKTESIDIPGGDGVLDLTEFFGDVKYNNRILTFEFSTIVPQSEFMTQFSRVQDALHGRKMQIILDDDSEWYYVGRISVNEWQAEKAIGKITIECDCEPYKCKLADTVVTVDVDGTRQVILKNTRKPVIPLITITGNINLTFDTNFYSLSDGDYELPAVKLTDGNNAILLEGTGTASFRYLQRGL